MWYLPEPNKNNFDKYVSDFSRKIKKQKNYAAYNVFLEKDEKGKSHDFIKDLLEGKPSFLYRLNEVLMKRIIGDGYRVEDMKVLTEVVKKVTKSKRSDKKLTLKYEEKTIYDTYYRKVEDLRSIFNYDWISKDKSYAYWLSNVKHTNVCPYCNRQYTMTLEKKNGDSDDKFIAKPHFDHWFPQESFPLLALSFYNLIPSCPVCNTSLKGSQVMSLNDYIHPYEQVQGYEPQFKFRVLLKGDKDFELYETVSTDRREENMLEDFGLREIYKYHEQLEIGDLVKLKRAHNDTYLTKLMSSILKDLNESYSVGEIIRMIFGAEIDAAHLNDRPLSKLKKDLLIQFEILDQRGNIRPELRQRMKKNT